MKIIFLEILYRVYDLYIYIFIYLYIYLFIYLVIYTKKFNILLKNDK